MKTVVETGRVIDTDGETASVMIEQGASCKGCGNAKLGLCRPGGAGMLLRVQNTLGASRGDRVVMGLEKKTHLKGYLLAFILPLLSFLLASLGGYMLSEVTGVKGVEVVVGLAGLSATAFYSLRRLKALDKAGKMHIKRIIRDAEFRYGAATGAEEMDYLAGYADTERTR